MKRRKQTRIQPKHLLLILTVLLFGVMFASYIFDIRITPLNYVTGYVFVPVQTGLGKLGNGISDGVNRFSDMSKVYDENQRLKAELDELNEQVSSLKLAQYDVEKLKSLLELGETYSDYNKVSATIIGKDPGNWFQNFTINVGENDGITKGMNVISDEGLCGIVIETGPNYSKVKSIIDDLSAVSSMVLSTSDNCIVSGSLTSMDSDGTIEFSNLRDDNDRVVVGDQIVTSYISSEYLPGILIGYIQEIHRQSNNLTKAGKLTPVVDFERLKYVFVITDLKEDWDA